MDAGRKFDLEEIAQKVKNARSQSEREYFERLGYRLINESVPVRDLRDQLIRAVRSNDVPKIKRIQQHIAYIRAEETNGASWGNDKGNRYTN